MDVGLLDEVDNRRPITGRDREAFYQLMAAAARSKPGELLRAADARLQQSGEESYSVYPLFRQDQSQKGRLVALTGMAREVVRIPVDDPDIVARFGIDHYYQIALFTDDSQGNPIYFCVRELPQGMPTGAGPRFGEDVRVAGFFLKTWVYRTVADPAAPYEEKPGRGPVAPRLIGRDLVWYRQPERSSSVIAGAIAGGLFVVALLGVWVAIWRFNRGDRQFQRQTLTKTLGIDRPVRLDDLAADQPGSEPGQPADRDADRDRGDGFSF
jgi:hypothetical protein